MKQYDVTFVGHMCYDEIQPFGGEKHVAPGSAVLCGAMVAARIGRRVAVVTRMSPADEPILAPLKAAGVDVHLLPAAQTTYAHVIHPSADVDVRRLMVTRDAGLFRLAELPPLQTACLHLAGISDHEFDLALVEGLHQQGQNLSADMQSFVRQIDPATREIMFRDVADKQRIVSRLNKVKLDVVEAEVLTGTRDLERAAVTIESWGCPEVVITQAAGVLARHAGRTYYETFTNRSTIGRTGRGDTTFAAYLSHRLEHPVAESLKFAAALVSIKMESVGPFAGTLGDVLKRMGEPRSSGQGR